jgi:hypothetical protein
MPDPIVEKITLAIKAIVETVTTGNGYTVTLTAVRPSAAFSSNPPTPKHLETYVEHAGSWGASMPGQAHGWKGWVGEWVLSTFVAPGDADTEAYETWLNKIAADLYGAFMATEKNRTHLGDANLEGFVVHQDVTANEWFVDPGSGREGVQTTLEITFRHNRWDARS